jgi:hypothetical protein
LTFTAASSSLSAGMATPPLKSPTHIPVRERKKRSEATLQMHNRTVETQRPLADLPSSLSSQPTCAATWGVASPVAPLRVTLSLVDRIYCPRVARLGQLSPHATEGCILGVEQS